MRYLWLILTYMFLIVGLSACQAASPTGSVSQTITPGSIPESTQAQPSNPLLTPESTDMPSNPPSVEKFVSLSKKDLGNRLQIDVNRITLVKSEAITWPNAALGCPRPGQFYAPGRVPGFQIWLDVEGTEYIYNTDFNGTLVLCPELNPHLPNSTSGPTPGVPID